MPNAAANVTLECFHRSRYQPRPSYIASAVILPIIPEPMLPLARTSCAAAGPSAAAPARNVRRHPSQAKPTGGASVSGGYLHSCPDKSTSPTVVCVIIEACVSSVFGYGFFSAAAMACFTARPAIVTGWLTTVA